MFFFFFSIRYFVFAMINLVFSVLCILQLCIQGTTEEELSFANQRPLLVLPPLSSNHPHPSPLLKSLELKY